MKPESPMIVMSCDGLSGNDQLLPLKSLFWIFKYLCAFKVYIVSSKTLEAIKKYEFLFMYQVLVCGVQQVNVGLR